MTAIASTLHLEALPNTLPHYTLLAQAPIFVHKVGPESYMLVQPDGL